MSKSRHTRERSKWKLAVGSIVFVIVAVVLFNRLVGPHLPSWMGRTTVGGSSSAPAKSYHTELVDLQCNSKVQAFAGVKVKADYSPPVLDWFGDVSVGSAVIDKAIPVQGLACSSGIETLGVVYSTNGIPTAVNVLLPTDELQDLAVNDLSVDMCASLTSEAAGSPKAVAAAVKAYKRGTCNLEGRATGFAINEGTAQNADEFSRQLADLAGSLQPIPAKQAAQVIADAKANVLTAEKQAHPGLPVTFTMTPAPTPFQHLLSGWKQVKPAVKALFTSYVFTTHGDATILTVNAGNTHGSVTLNRVAATPAELKELNG